MWLPPPGTPGTSMQRDRGRSSTDRREAAILRAWRVGNSLAAIRAGKRHAGRTHKSRHMQNEARCISHNSPNELLPRVSHTSSEGIYVATLSHMCALHNTRCCTWCSHKAGGAVASFTHSPCTSYITWFRLLRQSRCRECALHFHFYFPLL